MAFQKGASGNPQGRPPGTGTAGKIRALIESRSEDLIAVIIEQALAGCTASQKILLDRTCPVLRSRAEDVQIPNLGVGTPPEKAELVMAGILAGTVTLEDGRHILAALTETIGVQKAKSNLWK